MYIDNLNASYIIIFNKTMNWAVVSSFLFYFSLFVWKKAEFIL